MLHVTEVPGYEYQRVAGDIAARIASGEYPRGSMLPGERAMAEEQGVAIGTVRRAVAELRERGLVVTLPHKGTFVTPRPELCRAPRGTAARPSLDASGCVLSGPGQSGCVRVASPAMDEDDEPPRRVRLSNAEWRYAQVAGDLEARIRDGEFPYEAKLPARHDLAAEYGVGEMTVRHALRVLAGRGLVRLMPSRGTIVIWTGHNEGTA